MIRRTITSPKLSEYLKFEFKYDSFSQNIQYNTTFFNTFSFFGLLTIVCLGMGFLRPLFWSVAITNVILVCCLYFKARKFAESILVRRKAPSVSRERKEIEIIYEISNPTAFPLKGLKWVEDFDGVQKGSFLVNVPRSIPPHTSIKHCQRLILDGGMGVKKISPSQIKLSDELGIFEFTVVFHKESEIEVYPFLEETPKLKASVSPDSIEYGFYEISKRGDSNLFIGTREYRHGDPVKHINWKLTKKGTEVIVNEYEKSTNTFVTLLLDLEYDNQLGSGEQSTWETAKDLALSISTNEIRKNNLIQVVSNNLFIPFGNGKNQLALIEKHFTFHELVSTGDTNHLKFLQNLPSQGQLYYLAPLIITPKIVESFSLLMRLKALGQKITIFLLDPYQDMSKAMRGEMRIALREVERHSRAESLGWVERFKKMGVSVSIIRVGADATLNEQLLSQAKELIEEK